MISSPCSHESLTTASLFVSPVFPLLPSRVLPNVQPLVNLLFSLYKVFLDDLIYLLSMCQSLLNLNLQSLDSNFQTRVTVCL